MKNAHQALEKGAIQQQSFLPRSVKKGIFVAAARQPISLLFIATSIKIIDQHKGRIVHHIIASLIINKK